MPLILGALRRHPGTVAQAKLLAYDLCLARRPRHRHREQRPKHRARPDAVVAGSSEDTKPRRKWREFIFPSHWAREPQEPPPQPLDEEGEGGVGVREPRRPLPSAPSATVAKPEPD